MTAPRCRPAMASPGAHSRLLGASPPGGYGRNCWARTSGSGTSFRLGVSSRRPALGPTGLRQTRITSNTSCCGLLFPCRKARKASFVTGSQLRVPQLPGTDLRLGNEFSPLRQRLVPAVSGLVPGRVGACGARPLVQRRYLVDPASSICLSQRLSHACLSTSLTKVKPRMAH